MLINGFDNNVDRYSDEELLEEIEAINNLYDEIMANPQISDDLKDKLREHAYIIQEEKKKRDEGEEWIYPLTSFGILSL